MSQSIQETKIYELVSNGTLPKLHYRLTDEDPPQKIYLSNNQSLRALCHVSFTERDEKGNLGKRRTIRYYRNASSIYFEEQIKDGFAKNEKFKAQDRQDLYFKNGFLTTKDPKVILFLETSPQFEGFTGERDSDTHVLYRVFNPAVNSKKTKAFVVRQSDAVQKVKTMKDADIERLIIRIFGKAVIMPEDESDRFLMLVELINESEEGQESNLDTIINFKTEENDFVDESDEIVGMAILKGIIDFATNPDFVLLKSKEGNSTELIQVVPTYNYEQKVNIFTDWLKTKEGEVARGVIKEAIEEATAEKEKPAE